MWTFGYAEVPDVEVVSWMGLIVGILIVGIGSCKRLPVGTVVR